MHQIFCEQAAPPIVVIHGGAGTYPQREDLVTVRRDLVSKILNDFWPELLKGLSAVEAACQIVEQLEAAGEFNAGFGAVIQSDGMARLSASLMDGHRQKFSGVQLVTHLIHPSKLAYELQNREESVLGPFGAQLLARELGIPPQNPVTVENAQRWVNKLEKQQAERTGTVGVVVLDQQRHLAACTSTGGSQINTPERMSDSATVAGNYASEYAAISCTGTGEQIVSDAVAARLETRVRDGGNIIQASELLHQEASQRNHEYGWIGVDHQGNLMMACTTNHMPCAAKTSQSEELILG